MKNSYFTSNFYASQSNFNISISLLKIVKRLATLWFQLEDMFQIVTPQGNEKVTIQIKDTPTKVYTMCQITNFARKMGGYKFGQVNAFLASRDFI